MKLSIPMEIWLSGHKTIIWSRHFGGLTGVVSVVQNLTITNDIKMKSGNR